MAVSKVASSYFVLFCLVHFGYKDLRSMLDFLGCCDEQHVGIRWYVEM
jgi:hypothetical protein